MANNTSEGHICSHNHSFALDNGFRRLLQSPYKIVGPYIQKGNTIIDLGCGPGFFTVDMAKMAGSSGMVVAIDLQEEMLDKIAQKLFDTELANRVRVHQCSEQSLELEHSIQADFILAYYMVHETPDHEALLSEVKQLLKPGGKFLIVEPPFHVTKKKFQEITKLADKVGFKLLEKPKRKGGRSLLLTH